jgi:hypothetical protein
MSNKVKHESKKTSISQKDVLAGIRKSMPPPSTSFKDKKKYDRKKEKINFKDYYKEEMGTLGSADTNPADFSHVAETMYADGQDETTPSVQSLADNVDREQLIQDIIGDLEELKTSFPWTEPLEDDVIKAMAQTLRQAGVEPTDLDAAVGKPADVQKQYLITGPSSWKGGNGALNDLKAILAGNEPQEITNEQQELTPKSIHDLADRKKITWDNDPNFMKLTQKLTGKITLSTDPNWYGADVGDYKASGPVVNISAAKLVGFEPDEKMSQPNSKVNVKKIVAGLKKGDKLPPILVRKYKDGYQVVDGHHRFWAYKLLGVKSIPSQVVPDEDIIVKENFADGKKPGRKGLAKRSGVDCSKSETQLRKIAKNSSGEKQRMAHWCANMKGGNGALNDLKAILAGNEPQEITNEQQELTPEDIHDLADRKKIIWDEDPNFMRLTQKLTGKKHLDDLNQEELRIMRDYLEGLEEDESNPAADLPMGSTSAGDPLSETVLEESVITENSYKIGSVVFDNPYGTGRKVFKGIDRIEAASPEQALFLYVKKLKRDANIPLSAEILYSGARKNNTQVTLLSSTQQQNKPFDKPKKFWWQDFD